MRYVVAVLAGIVALEYGVIGFGIVPRLARLARVEGRLLTLSRWGAAVFFAGCAATHVGIALAALFPQSEVAHAGMAATLSDAEVLVQHVLPHLAQVVGGAMFIGIAYRHLEVNVTSKEVAAELRELEMHFRSAFERAPVGIALVSVAGGANGAVLQVNRALCDMVGYDEETLRRSSIDELLVHPGDHGQGQESLRTLLAGEQETADLEQRYLHSDGHEVWVSVEASLMRDPEGTPLYTVSQVRDITEERRQEAQLRYLAEHDSLTGVYNRRRFEEELDRCVASVRRYGEPAALLVVDLDHFKYVNDTYGHRAGDLLICRVVTVLASRLRETDVLGRLGGDEFGVLLPHTSEDGALLVADALLQAVRAEGHVRVQERTVRAGASIGVKVVRAEDLVNGEQLLAEADVAMYEAKESGRDRVSTVVAGEHGASRMRARLTWSERIRDALDGDGFVLWEQPILNLATGECDRSELLVRMVDPRDGSIVPPGHFLYIAERFGQIQAIDRWVLSQAVDLLELRHAAGDHRTLEVNLSGASLTDERLIDELAARLRHSPVDPTRVVVEVTETAAVGNIDVARTLAARLSDIGCRFALDDFGSGFGSFFYLKHLHFDMVKVDGEFVKDLPDSTDDRLVLEAIATIAHGMGKEITAEFVQNDATLDLLRDLGVGFAQGYHIAVPHPVPELA